MGRLEYFVHTMVSFVLFVGLLVLAMQFEERYRIGSRIALIVTFVLYFVTETIATIKRLHDLDRSGVQVFGFLVPFYNMVLWLKTTFERGTVGPNAYGADPLGASTKIEQVPVKPSDPNEPKWSTQSVDKKDNEDNNKDRNRS